MLWSKIFAIYTHTPHTQTYTHTRTYTHTHTHTHTHTESQLPDVKYATIEVFLNRGLRVNGDIGPALAAQLSSTSGNTKNHSDEKGWFTDNYIPHATLLNIFTQHGWSLATAFQSNSIPPGSSSGVPSDTLVFTHPNSWYVLIYQGYILCVAHYFM